MKLFSSPVESAHDRADGNVEDLGDLGVGETLHIGQQNRDAVVVGQVFHRLFHLVIDEQPGQLVLDAAAEPAGVGSQPPVEVQILHRP